MASSDLRDVLNLPAESHTNPARIGKKGRPYGPRSSLKGLAREVQSLGGDTPIAIVQQQLVFKRKRFASRKPAAKWEKRPFTNSARDDPTLVLKHWKRKDALTLGPHGEELPPYEAEDSIFAKYNAKVHIPQYTDEQYDTHLHHENWTKEETDYLLELISDFDLRWPLIWDRYDYAPQATDGDNSPDEESKAIMPASMTRTMEDLKTRYYEVAAKMMAVEKPVQYMSQSEKTLYEIILNYNPTQERIRKEFVANSLSRSKEEAREEELLLVEIKRVLGRNERFNEERRELYQRLDYPKADQHDITSLKTSAGLQNLLQTLMSTDKTKKRKSLVGPGEGIAAPGSAISGSSVSAANASGIASTSAATASTPVQEQTPIQQEAASSPIHSSTIVTIPAPTASSATVVATPTSAHHTSGHSRRESMTVATPMSATAKKGAHPLLERKKLSEQEMAIYGVSHHDRLNSGASFRTERTNKLFASKSNQQQIRITNVLTELEIPPRLTMPTANVSIAFEKLLHSVNGLLDCRKVTDKLEAEIKLEMAKKAELEKVIAAVDAVATSGRGEGGDEAEAASTDNAPQAVSDAEQGHSGKNENDAMDMTSEESETDEERESRSTSEGDGQHKRSASVFSSTSDKTTKRQRK